MTSKNRIVWLAIIAFATNLFEYEICRLADSSFFLVSWITPIVCYLWSVSTRQLAGSRYLRRFVFYAGGVLGGLIVFGVLQVWIEPPSGFGEIVYLGYLPLCVLQLLVSAVVAALPNRSGV